MCFVLVSSCTFIYTDFDGFSLHYLICHVVCGHVHVSYEYVSYTCDAVSYE